MGSDAPRRRCRESDTSVFGYSDVLKANPPETGHSGIGNV